MYSRSWGGGQCRLDLLFTAKQFLDNYQTCSSGSGKILIRQSADDMIELQNELLEKTATLYALVYVDDVWIEVELDKIELRRDIFELISESIDAESEEA